MTENVVQEETVNFEESVHKEFLKIIENAENCMDDIDKFVDGVAGNLSEFEIENMNILKQIDFKHQEVEEMVDQALENIDQYENELNQYEKSLVNLRSNFDELEMFSAWEQNQKNQFSLFNQLSDILKVIDLEGYEIGNLFDIHAVTLSTELDEYSQQLISINQRDLPPGISQILAVKTQLMVGEQATKKFCAAFAEFIDKLMKYIISKTEFREPSNHQEIHTILNIYAPIVARVKILDPLKYSEICNIYNKNFNSLYNYEWSEYFKNLKTKIPQFDAQKCKKEGHTIFYREENDFKNRCQLITQLIETVLQLIFNVTRDLGCFGNIFFRFTAVANELADDTKTESDIPTRKRRGGELKLREMQRVIFGFLLSYLQPFLWQLEESDPFYIIPLYDLTERFSVKDKENDYFCVLLAEVLKDLDDRVKKLSALATAHADSKKTKKGNLTDLLKIYKEFMTTCAIVFPKSRPETFPPLTMLRCLLQNVLDHINSASLETNEKSNDEISLIENLYNLDTCIVDARIPALAEDRKQVRQKRTAEVEKYVTNSIVLQFSKFIGMTDEIDKKLASKSSSVQIQTYVYTNRNEYKKLGKDFTFKIIKKSIEKVFKSVKKQCTDKVLFTSIWHLIAEQIIRQIEKIHEYLKTYFVRIPEVQVDFEIDDLKQFMSSLDMES